VERAVTGLVTGTATALGIIVMALVGVRVAKTRLPMYAVMALAVAAGMATSYGIVVTGLSLVGAP
jgi:hypothetical protein